MFGYHMVFWLPGYQYDIMSWKRRGTLRFFIMSNKMVVGCLFVRKPITIQAPAVAFEPPYTSINMTVRLFSH
jgi:hypothetical protein